MKNKTDGGEVIKSSKDKKNTTTTTKPSLSQKNGIKKADESPPVFGKPQQI